MIRSATRRGVLASLVAVSACASAPSKADAVSVRRLEDLQARAGGRLGVHAIELGSGRAFGLNADQRFGMCSTFKAPLAIVVLREVDASRVDLATETPLRAEDLQSYAPGVKRALAAGRTSLRIDELIETTLLESDNTAANLLLARIGGPAGLTASMRALGDPDFRVDRTEPTMNLVPPGEVRDTTTPQAMARFLARVARGELLKPASQVRLETWLRATRTGLLRLRAGFPPDWVVGDRTGTGQHETMPDKINAIAIAWPPARAPIVVAAFYEAPGSFDTVRPQDQAVLAEVGRIVARAWG